MCMAESFQKKNYFPHERHMPLLQDSKERVPRMCYILNQYIYLYLQSMYRADEACITWILHPSTSSVFQETEYLIESDPHLSQPYQNVI